MAMGLPPLTGESSRNIPASLACWYSSRMMSGAVELRSTITLPGLPYWMACSTLLRMMGWVGRIWRITSQAL